MRSIQIDRAEAEFLVDACERDRIPQWMELAAEIRKLFGMAPFPIGAVSPESTKQSPPL